MKKNAQKFVYVHFFFVTLQAFGKNSRLIICF